MSFSAPGIHVPFSDDYFSGTSIACAYVTSQFAYAIVEKGSLDYEELFVKMQNSAVDSSEKKLRSNSNEYALKWIAATLQESFSLVLNVDICFFIPFIDSGRRYLAALQRLGNVLHPPDRDTG